MRDEHTKNLVLELTSKVSTLTDNYMKGNIHQQLALADSLNGMEYHGTDQELVMRAIAEKVFPQHWEWLITWRSGESKHKPVVLCTAK
jgi:hypothetical protein